MSPDNSPVVPITIYASVAELEFIYHKYPEVTSDMMDDIPSRVLCRLGATANALRKAMEFAEIEGRAARVKLAEMERRKNWWKFWRTK